jgi:hypothetical protein
LQDARAEDTVRHNFRKGFVATLPFVLAADLLSDYVYGIVYSKPKPDAALFLIAPLYVLYVLASFYYAIDILILNKNSNEH